MVQQKVVNAILGDHSLAVSAATAHSAKLFLLHLSLHVDLKSVSFGPYPYQRIKLDLDLNETLDWI